MKNHNNHQEQGGQHHEETQTQQNVQKQSIENDDMLETRIVRVLHEQADVKKGSTNNICHPRGVTYVVSDQA